ncbi:MAG: hypothetical protein ACRDT2_05190 [Natronosporangium sp.]
MAAWERDEDVVDRDADDDLEPPVPSGLGTLTAAQRALADSSASTTTCSRPPPKLLHRSRRSATIPATSPTGWPRLPAAEKNRLVARVVQGEAARVRMELLRRYRGDTAAARRHGMEVVGPPLDG